MTAFIIALIPLIQALVGGSAASVTLAQWITIGAQALSAAPTIVKDLPKILTAVHPAAAALAPAFHTFAVDLEKSGVETAAANMHRAFQTWCAANADTAMRLQGGAGDDA